MLLKWAFALLMLPAILAGAAERVPLSDSLFYAFESMPRSMRGAALEFMSAEQIDLGALAPIYDPESSADRSMESELSPDERVAIARISDRIQDNPDEAALFRTAIRLDWIKAAIAQSNLPMREKASLRLKLDRAFSEARLQLADQLRRLEAQQQDAALAILDQMRDGSSIEFRMSQFAAPSSDTPKSLGYHALLVDDDPVRATNDRHAALLAHRLSLIPWIEQIALNHDAYRIARQLRPNPKGARSAVDPITGDLGKITWFDPQALGLRPQRAWTQASAAARQDLQPFAEAVYRRLRDFRQVSLKRMRALSSRKSKKTGRKTRLDGTDS